MSSWHPNGGWDDLWYKTTDGVFVADIDINTGTNNPITPACNAAPAAQPAPAPAPQPAVQGRSKGDTGQTNVIAAGGFGGQCTDSAQQKIKQNAGYYIPALRGNAMKWADQARAAGWTVVADAQPRSVVVFQPGVQHAGGVGHVAWVDSVQNRADGRYISVTEMNYGGNVGKWHTRTIKDIPGMSYILIP